MSELPVIDTLWNYQFPNETENKFRELLLNEKVQQNTVYKQELLTQLARTLGLQRKFEEGLQILDTLKDELAIENSTVYIRYLLERGRLLNSSRNITEAFKLFEQAWQFGVTNDEEYYAIDALHMMAIAAPSNEKLKWQNEGIKLAETTKDPRGKKWLGSLYNNTAWNYHDDLKDYPKAMEIFKKTLDWQLANGNENSIGIAKWCIARCHRSLNEIDIALEKQQALLVEKGGVDKTGYIYEEIGESLLLLDHIADSQPYFKKAHDLLSQDTWLATNQKERLLRLKELC